MPPINPISAASTVNRRRISPRRRAQRLQHADLARALVDGHHHGVGHAQRRHQQRQPAHGAQQRLQQRQHLVGHIQDRFQRLRLQVEIFETVDHGRHRGQVGRRARSGSHTLPAPGCPARQTTTLSWPRAPAGPDQACGWPKLSRTPVMVVVKTSALATRQAQGQGDLTADQIVITFPRPQQPLGQAFHEDGPAGLRTGEIFPGQHARCRR